MRTACIVSGASREVLLQENMCGIRLSVHSNAVPMCWTPWAGSNSCGPTCSRRGYSSCMTLLCTELVFRRCHTPLTRGQQCLYSQVCYPFVRILFIKTQSCDLSTSAVLFYFHHFVLLNFFVVVSVCLYSCAPKMLNFVYIKTSLFPLES